MFGSRILSLGISILFALILTCCKRRTPSSSVNVSNSKPADNSLYPQVGGMMLFGGTLNSGLKNGFFCSGVLLCPKVVLTAAHCLNLKDKLALFGPVNVIFRAGDEIEMEGQLDLQQSIIHPEYQQMKIGYFGGTSYRFQDEFDLGIAILQKPMLLPDSGR